MNFSEEERATNSNFPDKQLFFVIPVNQAESKAIAIRAIFVRYTLLELEEL